MIKSRNPDYIINTIAKSRITEKIRSNEDYLSTDDAESPPPDIVRLVVLAVLSDLDIVTDRPSVTDDGEVPPVKRSALVFPDLSPMVLFGFTELVDSPPLI
jgi:hypothetical protein